MTSLLKVVFELVKLVTPIRRMYLVEKLDGEISPLILNELVHGRYKNGLPF
jgi:hypothetical protein